MTAEVREWLARLELGHLAPAFEEHQIGMRDLVLLSEDDLKEIGLALGPRRRIMHAISTLADAAATGGKSSGTGPPAAADAERRQLTVMFIDLVGSTALSARIDAEDLRELMQRYQTAVAAAIERNGGYVANYLGDGVIAFFGWPSAREDQAVLAVRAGLSAVEDVARIPLAGSDREKLAARAGIATGQVVVGDLADETIGQQGMVTGETPNLAARLQAVAPPGGVVIGRTTRALVGGAFDLDFLGQQDLKGFSAPVDAWAVRAEHDAENRFEAPGRRLTPFTGRTHEVGLLIDRWRQVEEGEGQVVLISGEPGIGKSRIVQAFRDRIEGDRHRRILYQCSPHHVNSALYPAIRQLEHAAGLAAGDTPETKLDRIEAVLRQATPETGETARLIAALLSVPFEDRYGALDMPAQQQRIATLRALQDQLVALAADEPVLFVLEDAHWIDPTTQELIIDTVPRLTERHVLMLITHRPEWHDPFHGQGHVTTLNMTRLSRSQIAAIVRDVAGQDLSDDVVARIVERTDGVPLFVEELTKAMTEAGFDHGDEDVPVTLQASLMARLDRLGPAKEIAQIGAVIGREFGRDLLVRVTGGRRGDLTAALDRLVDSQLIFRARQDEGGVYTFKHALIQDVAYDSLLRRRRQELHLAIAEALSADDGPAAAPEVLARHFERGGDLARAMELWERAGDAAAGRSAQPEAAAHYQNALKLLRTSELSPDRGRECALLLRLGQAQLGAFGGGFPTTVATFERVAALALQDATPEVRMLAQYGHWTSQIIAGNFLRAAAIADDMASYAEDHGAAWIRAVPARPRATTLYQMGHLRPARAILDPIVDSVERLSAELPEGFAHDPLLLVPAVLAHIEWLLGEREAAYERSSELVDVIARKTSNPNSISHAYIYDVILSGFARDPGRAREVATRLQAHTERTSGRGWEVTAHLGLGIVDVLEGRAESAVARLARGVESYAAAGARQFIAFHMLFLAEAHHVNGDPPEALKALEAVRELIEQTEQRVYEPEMHRQRGVVLESIGRADEAAAAYCSAIAIAEQQGSLSWRDRGAENLARLGAAGSTSATSA